MAQTTVVTARTPGGQLVALPVLDLDGSGGGGGEQQVAGGVPNLSGALVAIEDFSQGFRKAVQAVAPRKATVEFSMSFAVQAGKVIALFAEGRAEGSVRVTLEWGGTEAGATGAGPDRGTAEAADRDNAAAEQGGAG